MVFAERARAGLRVIACSREAARAGVRPGWPLAEALALWPMGAGAPRPTGAGAPRPTGTGAPKRAATGNTSRPVPAPAIWRRSDPKADRQALHLVAQACQRYAPLTGVEDSGENPPEAIFLDIAGCEHLHGGERKLLQDLMKDFARQGYEVQAAVSETVGAAWALAHHGNGMVSVPAGQLQRALQGLPLAALRIAPEICDALRQLQILTISDLQRLPRTSLPARFGKVLLRRLDEALGIRPETFAAEKFVEPLSRTWTTEHPLASQRGLDEVFRQLLESLLETLAVRRAGLLDLRCEFTGERPIEPIVLRLSRPAGDEKHLRQLFSLRCERHDWAAGILKMTLEVERVGWLAERSRSLFDDEDEQSARAVEGLLERLCSRLGEQAVLRSVDLPDPLPERSFRLEPCLAAVAPTASATGQLPGPMDRLRARHRPCRLLVKPQRLDVLSIMPEDRLLRVTWHGQSQTVTRIWGPERIETGWWRTQDVRRDYYRLETDRGEHWWVFRRLDSGAWFLQGWF